MGVCGLRISRSGDVLNQDIHLAIESSDLPFEFANVSFKIGSDFSYFIVETVELDIKFAPSNLSIFETVGPTGNGSQLAIDPTIFVRLVVGLYHDYR
jgi:hypothetical protein